MLVCDVAVCPPHCATDRRTSADLNDPGWPYNATLPAQLYNMNCNAYESIMLCQMAIFRGFVNPEGETDGTRTSGEHNEVYLGFSRDGFHVSTAPHSLLSCGVNQEVILPELFCYPSLSAA